MIVHIVLLKLLVTITPSDIENLTTHLKQLQAGPIPQIQQLSYGKNNSQEQLAQGYTYGFSMSFASEKDRDYYLHHPAHLKVAREIKHMVPPEADSILVFDYTLRT